MTGEKGATLQAIDMPGGSLSLVPPASLRGAAIRSVSPWPDHHPLRQALPQSVAVPVQREDVRPVGQAINGAAAMRPSSSTPA